MINVTAKQLRTEKTIRIRCRLNYKNEFVKVKYFEKNHGDEGL